MVRWSGSGRGAILLPVRSVAASPLGATILHGIALWFWHAPTFYEAALASNGIHWLQHASFFSALLFWWALIYARGRQGYGAAVFYLFATALHTGFLGVLLLFAGAALPHSGAKRGRMEPDAARVPALPQTAPTGLLRAEVWRPENPRASAPRCPVQSDALAQWAAPAQA